MHIHLGWITIIQFAACLIVVGIIFRGLEAYFHDTKFGQAMAFIY